MSAFDEPFGPPPRTALQAERIRFLIKIHGVERDLDAGRRRLLGDCVMDQALRLPPGMGQRQILGSPAQIDEQVSEKANPRGAGDLESPFPFLSSEEALSVWTEERASLPSSRLYLVLPASWIERAAETVEGYLEVEYRATLQLPKKAASEVPTNCAFVLEPVTAPKLSTGGPGSSQERWFRDARTRMLTEHLYLYCLDGYQTKLMMREFAESIARIRADLNEVTGPIAELVSALRDSVRPEESPPGEDFGSIWEASPRQFEGYLSKRPADEVKKLRVAYDTIWRPFDLHHVIGSGESTAGAKKDGLEPNAQKLEQVARKYLALPAGRSPTLEWVLIDALLYCECVAFAQVVLAEKSFFGTEIPGELKGASAGANFKKALKMSGKALTIEVVALAATAFVAAALAPSSTEAFWIILIGVTGARWMRSAILKSSTDDPKLARGKLLLKMVAVHKLLKTERFSAEHIRDQLNRVAEEGAVFSGVVYELLDSRIRAESVQQAAEGR